jgi:hypothetical protein
MQKDFSIDMCSSHRLEQDDSHTVVLTISGLPSMGDANRVSTWLEKTIRERAHEIGLLETNPPKLQ